MSDIINKLKQTLKNKLFINVLSDAKNNWLDLSSEEVVNNILCYFEALEFIVI